MAKRINKKNHSVLEEQNKVNLLQNGSHKESPQKDRATNMEEIAERGLKVWQDGFWDKYHLLSRGYKIATAFFITAGVLGVLASFVLFPVMESTIGSMEQIKGILLLALGSVFILASVFWHYFHIRGLKGASGLDEETKEQVEKNLIRQKLLASYGKTKAPEKLRKHKAKKKHRPKTQKESHQEKNAEAISTAENGAQPIPENKKQSEKEENKQESKKEHKKEKEKNTRKKEADSDAVTQEVSFDTSKPKKKKHEKKKRDKNNPVPSKDDAIDSDALSAPPAPSPPPSPPPVFMPITVPHEAKHVGLSNSAKKDMPVFSSKASSTIQARGAALAGLFKPSKALLPEAGKSSSSKGLT